MDRLDTGLQALESVPAESLPLAIEAAASMPSPAVDLTAGLGTAGVCGACLTGIGVSEEIAAVAVVALLALVVPALKLAGGLCRAWLQLRTAKLQAQLPSKED